MLPFFFFVFSGGEIKTKRLDGWIQRETHFPSRDLFSFLSSLMLRVPTRNSQSESWTPSRETFEAKARQGPPLLAAGELPASFSCVAPLPSGGEQRHSTTYMVSTTSTHPFIYALVGKCLFVEGRRGAHLASRTQNSSPGEAVQCIRLRTLPARMQGLTSKAHMYVWQVVYALQRGDKC